MKRNKRWAILIRDNLAVPETREVHCNSCFYFSELDCSFLLPRSVSSSRIGYRGGVSIARGVFGRAVEGPLFAFHLRFPSISSFSSSLGTRMTCY